MSGKKKAPPQNVYFMHGKKNAKGIQKVRSAISHSSSEKMTGGSSLSCVIQDGHGSSFQCSELFCGSRGSGFLGLVWIIPWLQMAISVFSHIFVWVIFLSFSGVNFRTPYQVETFTANVTALTFKLLLENSKFSSVSPFLPMESGVLL